MSVSVLAFVSAVFRAHFSLVARFQAAAPQDVFATRAETTSLSGQESHYFQMKLKDYHSQMMTTEQVAATPEP